MIDATTVGKTIAFLRRRQQLTQQGLAAAVNVSHQAVSKWENGAALPDMQTMWRMSQLFGVRMEDMLSGAPLAEERDERAAESPEAYERRAEENEEPATPPEEYDSPIELKLDGGALNADLLRRAEEAVTRAEENCAPDDATPASEAEADAHGPGSTFEEIVRLAPYVSPDALKALLEECSDAPSASQLVAIAPFLSRDALPALLARCEGALDWGALKRLAPFMGRDALADALASHMEGLDWEALVRLAPFLSRDGLARVLDMAPTQPPIDALRRLAPFMGRDALARQLAGRTEELDVDMLIALAPFLSRAALGQLLSAMNRPVSARQLARLARFLPKDQLDRLAYRAAGREPPKEDDWNLNLGGVWDGLGEAIGDLGNSIADGVQEVIRSAPIAEMRSAMNSRMKDVRSAIRDVIDEFSGADRPRQGESERQDESARERFARIRSRIAEKAFSDGNWDWIEAHADEVTGDILKQILLHCAEAGHGGLIASHVRRCDWNGAELCRLAQTTCDEAAWEQIFDMDIMRAEHVRRALDHIGRQRPEALNRFSAYAGGEEMLNAALRAMCAGEDVSRFVRRMSQPERLALARAALSQDYGELDALVDAMEAEDVPELVAIAAEAGRSEWMRALADRMAPSDIASAAGRMAADGRWEAVRQLLRCAGEMDVRALCDMALESGRLGALADMAGCADAASLRHMALAVMDREGFERLAEVVPVERLDEETLELLLEKAMAASDWKAIERIDEALNG